MKKSNRSIRGIAFYFMLLGIFIVGLAYSSYADRNQQVDTYADFCGWLEAGRVKAVYITPNEETPTGLVQVQLTNSEIHSFYAVDILRVEEKAEEYQVRVVVQDVDKPSWFWTLVFPYLVILIAVIIVFMVLGHSLGGGGSNSQVLNFGKSRAQMTDGKDNPTTFKDVIEVEVVISNMQDLKFEFTYTMRVDGKVVCIGQSTHCFMENGRPVVIARRLPELFEKISKVKNN